MERKNKLWKIGRRKIAGFLAITLLVTGIRVPVPTFASDIWPQKSTAPFYCLDGGKGWKASDRYEIYKYDTLPSALTEVQAKRLFWAYPSNWNALKSAAARYDIELYQEIAATVSGPNVVKRVKDDKTTKFAWVADNPEIEARAIHALEKMAAEETSSGKEAPAEIRDATSEENAVSFTVLPFSGGPGALDTEFVLGSEFISDIARIEAQSVWDNGSTGGSVGWLDASQDKNIAKAVMGEDLYEITWSGDSIKIHNNGSAVANENAVGSEMSEEEKYNKTTVRYKITMRENSGWYTEGTWNDDYLREWMDFKACVNAPGQQRLYKADIRVVPSDIVFYLVINQGESRESAAAPEYGGENADFSFRIFRHEETFKSNYNVKLKKIDDETGMPLKGSQFYLYERFEDSEHLSETEEDGKLVEEKLSFVPWNDFQIFAEGVTDEKGEIEHTDVRNYTYSKTYCDGHGMPVWAEAEDSEEVKDQNREAAKQWMEIYESCESEEENSRGCHFHWLVDDEIYGEVQEVLETGIPSGRELSGGADEETAFFRSGCKVDCEQTYENFINLRFSYTWKEIQARTGYILHGIHEDDIPVEIITTNSSEARAESELAGGSSEEIVENIWYSGNNEIDRSLMQKEVFDALSLRLEEDSEQTRMKVSDWNIENDSAETGESMSALKLREYETEAVSNSNASGSNAISKNTDSDAQDEYQVILMDLELTGRDTYTESSADDSAWEDSGTGNDFYSYLAAAGNDGIQHIKESESNRFSYCDNINSGRDYWVVRDHRTEGEIHINKRDMDLYKKETQAYSAYGDVEGDGTLEGAVYGLFAAEDILHPDSDLMENGTLTNTGHVYKKNDLVAVSVTDLNGDASFMTYTVKPGMTFNYETGEIEVRKDAEWNGPVNRYEENQELHGNWWIGRPLILGKYYVKELSRSEGYELSVNGKSEEWTNYGAGNETPEVIADSVGTVIVSMEELTAFMEGDAGGNGYDQLTFQITSSQTTDPDNGGWGYEITVSGFPEGTEFYRVDSGVQDVTGPHVTGTEDVVVKDENGEIIWKTADSGGSYVKYEPEYDQDGNIVGQTPMSRIEPQILKDEQVPEAVMMHLEDLSVDMSSAFWNEKVIENIVDNEKVFQFLKKEVEDVLNRNGYEVPVTADGKRSQIGFPVYSAGVKKGEVDIFGMTTDAGETAVKTVYGAAVKDILIEDIDTDTTVYELFATILSWYYENPEWSFGGIHDVKMTDEGCIVTVYAGASTKGSRRFFTMKEENGAMLVDCVYAVFENPKTLRWEYQKYDNESMYRYEVSRRYYHGSGSEKRYYIDVTLMPAMMVNENGKLQVIEHRVMVYHENGEEIVDYLSGDAAYGYKVPVTETIDKIEITTEQEMVEQDVLLERVSYDKTNGIYRIQVDSSGTDSFGAEFSDEDQSLVLSFVAKLPKKKVWLSEEDICLLGDANVQGYQIGDELGYAEYLIRFCGASISADTGGGAALDDTYIVSKKLTYRGQYKVNEDGDTKTVPVQVLERSIKQKVKIEKEILNEEAVKNFRFKIYLKSNLERLYCNEEGEITWIDRNNDPVDIKKYKSVFPELVQKIYTVKTERRLLETVKKTVIDSDGNEERSESYNYDKFFDAIRTANTDKWDTDGQMIWNTSWKPFAENLFTGVKNEINTSYEAKENAKRSDAVRQFAINWYLEAYVEAEEVTYTDEVYDKALYKAILEAEEYLTPFFTYDLDEVYAILWDSEQDGGIDHDMATLAADQIVMQEGLAESAYGVSQYLPYGDYVIAEQQPYKAKWLDFVNRHYKIDSPKEISLPLYYDDNDTRMIPSLVPWSVTEPGTKEKMSGYADQKVQNNRYRVNLRIEKLDKETGEPILFDDAVFAFYKAEREENADGSGSIKRYTEDTLLLGSRQFLKAMGATDIVSFARNVDADEITGAGKLYSGIVPAGTPICAEADCVIFSSTGYGKMDNDTEVTTVTNVREKGILQVTGYLETPDELEAGVYVLAELEPPAGYVRSRPIPIEIYSDAVRYYPDGGEEVAAAVVYGKVIVEDGAAVDDQAETARIYVNNTATSLEVSKKKTADSYRSMKISGRVEGSITALGVIYGLENLELAYNSSGMYLGFGWKKGTLEYLENRRASGERVELVYENGIFQGYGYVTRNLETANHENRYAAGATLALYEAIELRRSGDSEDFAYEGVQVTRDRNSNVTSIVVKEEYTGADEDVPVLFFDLSGLKVIDKDDEGKLYGYNRNGQKEKITFDTDSIYAIQEGKPRFEITGGDFSRLVYDSRAKAFTGLDDNMVIYHLDQDLCRDAQVDGYTGLAYVEKSGTGYLGQEEGHIFVWPVTEIKDSSGKVIIREKILTGRAGEKNEGTEQAYITGSYNSQTDSFEKLLNPVYDRYGMARYYPASDEIYKKGEVVYDRDGDYIGYQCEDLLKLYNMAAYGVLDPVSLYDAGISEGESDGNPLYHREGEAWIIPNIWTTGEKTPQDPENTEMTWGQEDLLRRVMPGTYIMEELKAPEGYVRALPIAVSVEETTDIQRVSMTDEKTKVEISKIDGTDQYRKSVVSNISGDANEWNMEAKGTYSQEEIPGVRLALYKAKRIYTSEYSKYPNGYYFVKAKQTPACWEVEDPVDNHKYLFEALWTTDGTPKYFEGIPAGDYILEELEVPEGYIPLSMEITVEEKSELQSFILKNDHTKLEIYKYEEIEGEKTPLTRPYEAELALYPAIVDGDGKVIQDGSGYLYDENPVAVWKTGGLAEYSAEIAEAYEDMFDIYGNCFKNFAWKKGKDHETVHMKMTESHETGNGETVTQLWEDEDGSAVRITVVKGDGRSQGITFEYQYDYELKKTGEESFIESYNTQNGLHRLNKIPIGVYILVETQTPDGYKSAEPMVVDVKEAEAVQRFYFENEKEETPERKGKLIIEKRDECNPEKTLEGAWFEVKSLQNGDTYRVVTDENGQAVLENLLITGEYESGITGPCVYQVREIQAPDGYQLDNRTWNVRFVENGLQEVVYQLNIRNRETEFWFSKSNFNTEHFVAGARLAIYETHLEEGKFVKAGEAIENWISEDIAHKITGKLSGGKTYMLAEEKAPDGYMKADPIRFTISADGKRIMDISDSFSQIQIAYEEDKIASVSVTGHTGQGNGYRLLKDETEILYLPATGEEICWNDVMEKQKILLEQSDGEVLILEEVMSFSDGSEAILSREHFRAERDSQWQKVSSGRFPLATQYIFRNAEGIRVDKWNVTLENPTYTMENELNKDGNPRFRPGQQYSLEEVVVFSDGSSEIVGKTEIKIDELGNTTTAGVLNRETMVKIKKKDLTTGNELPGAVLTVKDEEGIIIDEWISSEEEHIISGILIPGETYILSEVMAADGYAYAEEISFTVHENCTVEKIVMEDRPTHVEIRKTDIATGKELPGAELVLKDSEGNTIDQWVSGRTAHVIRGKMIAGETYILRETSAPDGYLISEEIEFTVSLDGSIDKIVMENRRRERKEFVKETEEPDEPQVQEEMDIENVKTYGKIVAVYHAFLSGQGDLHIEYPHGTEITKIPQTGESPLLWGAAVGAVISLAGCLWLYNLRRREHEEE